MTEIEQVKFTVAEAASWFGVTESTIYSWRRRNKIEPVGQYRGHDLYRFVDLARADREVRESPHGGRPRKSVSKADHH